MKEQDFLANYAKKLDDRQLAGVTTTEGAVLLLAVPGGGKTTVLVTRLGYLLLVKGVNPENVLTLTYTVAATSDMRRRFEGMFGELFSDSLDKMEFRTINGICAKIISRYAQLVGKQPFSLITDEKATAKILSDSLVKNLSEYPTESDIKTARTLITYCKNMMLSKQEVEELGKRERFPLLPVFEAYHEYLRANSLMDYDDQMRYALTMLQRTPQLLSYYQERFRYLLVDEAQDTSKIQHELIKLLAGNGNLFMVGDEDQSIYGFRAAYPEALLDFQKDHPKGRILLMDTNYRSNAEIVRMASAFIGHNKARHDKNMQAFREDGSKVRFLHVESRKAQYEHLLQVARECDRETAVLYRDNESALPLIDLLEREGIPYRVKNGDFSFFSSRVVTDVTNILRFALDPYDSELFIKIYFKCKAYLKKAQAMDLCRLSELSRVAVLEAAEEMPGIAEGTLENCRKFSRQLRTLITETPAKALLRIETSLGYGEYMDRNGLDDGKLFLLRMMARQERTILGFLSRLEHLQSMLLEKEYERNCPFVLSTIHSSKGLEYDRVFLMDVVDGVFPSDELAISKNSFERNFEKEKAAKQTTGASSLEEERRLFYVGMTRAMNDLTILCYDGMSSRFVRELKMGANLPRVKKPVARLPK